MYWNSTQGSARKFVGQRKVTRIWKRRIITRFIVTKSITADFPMEKSKQTVANNRCYGKKARFGKMFN